MSEVLEVWSLYLLMPKLSCLSISSQSNSHVQITNQNGFEQR